MVLWASICASTSSILHAWEKWPRASLSSWSAPIVRPCMGKSLVTSLLGIWMLPHCATPFLATLTVVHCKYHTSKLLIHPFYYTFINFQPRFLNLPLIQYYRKFIWILQVLNYIESYFSTLKRHYYISLTNWNPQLNGRDVFWADFFLSQPTPFIFITFYIFVITSAKRISALFSCKQNYAESYVGIFTKISPKACLVTGKKL